MKFREYINDYDSIVFESIRSGLYKYDKKTVGIMSWLYLLAIPYHGKMKLSNWSTDSRMGIPFSDAVDDLVQRKFVNVKKGAVNLQKNVKKLLLDYFMVSADQSLTYYQRFSFFKKFDTKNYPISQIPLDLYEMYFLYPEKSVIVPSILENAYAL